MPDTGRGDPGGTESGPNENASGGEELPIVVQELAELSTRTTPDVITLDLQRDVDHVGVRAHLSAAGGQAIEGCQVADIYRIGKNAVNWRVGGAFTLPLSYAGTLEPGVYTQSVRIYLDGGDFDATYVASHIDYFEVDDGGLRPITSTEYSEVVMPVMYGPGGEPYYAGTGLSDGDALAPEPCPEPEPYSDEVALEDATSSIQFDAWVDVHTLQPLRWVESAALAEASSAEYSLRFRARNRAGERLRLELWGLAPEQLESGFEAALESLPDPNGDSRSSQGRLILDQLDGTYWHSIGGRVRVQPRGGGVLSIELSSILLDKSRMITEPQVTRSVATGSIVGSWVAKSSP